MKITGNEPSCPISEAEKDRLDQYPNISYPGLSIRQQFAMAAMQGLLSNPSSEEVEIKFVREYIGLPSDAQYNFKEHYPMYIAKESSMYADALIAELNKSEAE